MQNPYLLNMEFDMEDCGPLKPEAFFLYALRSNQSCLITLIQ